MDIKYNEIKIRKEKKVQQKNKEEIKTLKYLA